MFWKYEIFTIDTEKGIYSYNSKNMSIMTNDVKNVINNGISYVSGSISTTNDTKQEIKKEDTTSTKPVVEMEKNTKKVGSELKPVVEVEKRVEHLYK
jgi:transcriptional regulator with PAS, ATPase and Fis domain